MEITEERSEILGKSLMDFRATFPASWKIWDAPNPIPGAGLGRFQLDFSQRDPKDSLSICEGPPPARLILEFLDKTGFPGRDLGRSKPHSRCGSGRFRRAG